LISAQLANLGDDLHSMADPLIQRGRQNDSGTVLSEFLLTFPLLLFMGFSLLELSRTIATLTWLSRSSYQIASVGGDSSASSRAGASAERAKTLLSFHNVTVRKSPVASMTASTEVNQTSIAGLARRNVSATIVGHMNPFIAAALNFSVQSVAPVLVIEDDVSTAGALGFTNPPVYYDCNLQLASEPSAGCS
jgi:hypothetical protein